MSNIYCVRDYFCCCAYCWQPLATPINGMVSVFTGLRLVFLNSFAFVNIDDYLYGDKALLAYSK